MFDDFFNVVKLRFNGGDEDEAPSFKCPRCQKTTPGKTMQENMQVCPNCGYSSRLTARDRLRMTCDKDNLGSAKSIINNGGILENEFRNSEGEIEQRYWITICN